jgi:hypothetical protein
VGVRRLPLPTAGTVTLKVTVYRLDTASQGFALAWIKGTTPRDRRGNPARPGDPSRTRRLPDCLIRASGVALAVRRSVRCAGAEAAAPNRHRSRSERMGEGLGDGIARSRTRRSGQPGMGSHHACRGETNSRAGGRSACSGVPEAVGSPSWLELLGSGSGEDFRAALLY